MEIFLIVISLIAFILVWYWLKDWSDSSKHELEEQRQIAVYGTDSQIEESRDIYDKVKKSIAIPNDAITMNIIQGEGLFSKCNSYAWVEGRTLCLFPSVYQSKDPDALRRNLVKYEIPIDDIEYFANRGEVYRENKISGGGGGGTSLGGLIVGGALAGDTGAIIGSRKKVEPIVSNLITHDKRVVVLNFKKGGNSKSFVSKYESFDLLKKLIPEKEYEVVESIRKGKIIEKELNNTSAITEKIRQISALHDDGILTDEEYSRKKAALLEQLN